jgi:hypothetical protein
LLILAELTTEGSFATEDCTSGSIESAKKHKDFVLGFVTTGALTEFGASVNASDADDFVVFTTGVDRLVKSGGLGQQYQTPESAVSGVQTSLLLEEVFMRQRILLKKQLRTEMRGGKLTMPEQEVLGAFDREKPQIQIVFSTKLKSLFLRTSQNEDVTANT